MLSKLLNEVVLDYNNPIKIYALAREYDKLYQGACAAGMYLRAADMIEGDAWYDRWLQYKSIILMAFVYDRNGNRDQTVSGVLKMAIDTMPERPEAYFFLSQFYQWRENWIDSLTYAKMGIACIESCDLEKTPDNDFDYPGDNALRILYARAKWKTDGRDATKNLAFDIKYKRVLNEKDLNDVNDLLKWHGYPSTLPYTWHDKDRYKHKFQGIENVEKNHSRHFQDMFVLSVLDGKRDGTFIEIGSGHPTLFNNTKLLEEEFGWKGISIDNSERMCSLFSRERKSSIILGDASKIDYRGMLKQHCYEKRIDFLRINAERASIEALKRIPFNVHEFSIIQFQHNGCWWGPELREESRNILSQIGYILLVPDVGINEQQAYEDWWVHPTYANVKGMKGKNAVNFAWDYIMEKL